MPNLKGKHIKAVLTFSDNDKAVEVRPAKGDLRDRFLIAQIDKASYEYSQRRSLYEAKTHWLKLTITSRTPTRCSSW